MYTGRLSIDLKVIIFILIVNYLYTAPTAIRTIRKEDSDGRYIKKHDLSSLKSVAVVG